TATQTAVGLGSGKLQWTEAVVRLTGAANVGETWALQLDLNGDGTPDRTSAYAVPEDGRALSRVVRHWADELNGAIVSGATFHAEATVDILGNAKLRLWATDASGNRVGFQTNVSITGSGGGGVGGAVVSGTPKQQSAADFTTLFGFQWTQAAFEVLRVAATEAWTLTLGGTSYTASASTVGALTLGLADLIDTRFLPVVSGYTVSLNTPWPAEIRSTVILSGQPVVGDLWSVELDIAGHAKTFSHTIVAGDTLEAIATALANAVKADPTGNLSAEASGVALLILNNAGNTD